MSNCGVYVIKNLVDGKMYVGSTENLRRRKTNHLIKLRANKHSNQLLQAAFNEHGEASFEFCLIEPCAVAELESKEQTWLNRFMVDGSLYNRLKHAYAARGINHPMYGREHTAEAREKIRESRSNQTIRHSADTRAKIGAAHKGIPADPEHIQRMVAARGGKAWNKGITAKDNPNLVNKHRIMFAPNVLGPIVTEYQGGASIAALARKHKCDWEVIRWNLNSAGVKTRTIGEQRRASFQLSSRERQS